MGNMESNLQVSKIEEVNSFLQYLILISCTMTVFMWQVKLLLKYLINNFIWNSNLVQMDKETALNIEKRKQ